MPIDVYIDGLRTTLSAAEETEHYEMQIRDTGMLPDNPSDHQIVRAAVYHFDWRDADAWVTKSASDLSSEIQSKKLLRPMRLGEFWRRAISKAADANEQAGMIADATEARKWQKPIEQLVNALERGDRYDAEDNITTMPGVVNQYTKDYAKAVISDVATSVVDLVCTINDVSKPADLSASAVEAALNEAGYTWSGSKWVGQ